MSQNRSSKGGRVSLSEINVTPMVDVMLVLLIVFMVSAPLLQQGVEVNLPKVDSGSLPQTNEPIVLTIKNDESVVLEDKTYQRQELLEKLKALAIARPDVQVLVHADLSAKYGTVARVMSQIKKSGIHRVGLVTLPETPE
jgi:biopolymer transport protein TolR